MGLYQIFVTLLLATLFSSMNVYAENQPASATDRLEELPVWNGYDREGNSKILQLYQKVF